MEYCNLLVIIEQRVLRRFFAFLNRESVLFPIVPTRRKICGTGLFCI